MISVLITFEKQLCGTVTVTCGWCSPGCESAAQRGTGQSHADGEAHGA